MTPPATTLRRFDPGRAGEVAALCVLAVIVLAAVFAPYVAPHDPLEQDLMNILQPPFATAAHPLGTDFLGRDILSRIIYGAQPPLLVGAFSVLLALVIGVPLGILSGWRDGWVDTAVGRLADIQMSIPGLVLALLVLAMLGKYLFLVVLIIALESWPLHYRVVRAYVQTVRGNGYIEAAKLAGVGPVGITVRHLLPGVVPLLAVTATANVATAVLAEAALSYLGMGVVPPTPDWGSMVAEGQTQLSGAWWISVMPGLALIALLLSVQLIGNRISSGQSLGGRDR